MCFGVKNMNQLCILLETEEDVILEEINDKRTDIMRIRMRWNGLNTRKIRKRRRRAIPTIVCIASQVLLPLQIRERLLM